MDQKQLTRLTHMVVAAMLTASLTAQANELLPTQIMGSKNQLDRCSQGELKAFRWIHVGYAALYLPKCQEISAIFNASPKRLRFLYHRSIPAKAFREASEEYLKINLGEKFSAWRQTFEQFNRHYRDIEDGDYYDLIFDPQTGLKLHLNDQLLATLDDPEKGLAYFNIWFGREPFSEDLKQSLLTPDL